MQIFKGTELKLNVHVDPIDNITLLDCDFQLEVYTNRNSKIIRTKDECIFRSTNDYVALIDTTDLREGKLFVKVTLYIPDKDFITKFGDSGIPSSELRTEVRVIKTNIYIKRP